MTLAQVWPQGNPLQLPSQSTAEHTFGAIVLAVLFIALCVVPWGRMR